MKTISYIVKCLSFQNQFWSGIAYIVALVATLSLVNSDESSYLTLYLENADVSTQIDSSFLKNLVN
jgi:hypothetical protein